MTPARTPNPGPIKLSMPRLCAEVAWRLFQAPVTDASEWMSHAAAGIVSLIFPTEGRNPPAVARIALLSRFAGESARILALGTSQDRGGTPRATPASLAEHADELGAALILAARRDWPDWGRSASGPAGVAGVGGARRGFIPDSAWQRHPLCGARTLLGFDEFVVFESPVASGGGSLWLTLQVDHRTGRPWDETPWIGIGAGAWPLAGQIFDSQVWRPVARRTQLLHRVSPAQRQILPLLAEGRTERAIAEAVQRSPHTVHDHVKQIYAALKITSRVELVDAWHGIQSAGSYHPRKATSAPTRPSSTSHERSGTPSSNGRRH